MLEKFENNCEMLGVKEISIQKNAYTYSQGRVYYQNRRNMLTNLGRKFSLLLGALLVFATALHRTVQFENSWFRRVSANRFSGRCFCIVATLFSYHQHQSVDCLLRTLFNSVLRSFANLFAELCSFSSRLFVSVIRFCLSLLMFY